MKEKKSLYFFPCQNTDRPMNPYSNNFKDSIENYYHIIEKDRIQKSGIRFLLLLRAFSADIYVLNWIESIKGGFSNFPLFVASYLALIIMRFRRKQIVWMFHNIHPHFGENMYSQKIQTFLFNNSSLIISHSKDAFEYAQSMAKCPVKYIAHPIKTIDENLCEDININHRSNVIFIWGNILPYKGIPEFLSFYSSHQCDLRIHIIGKCSNNILENKINSFCNDKVIYENRRADYSEISSLIKNSRYVLFPYIGESISSSGALIDTIVMGGIPVGPNKGAFKDLKEEGVCITYNNNDNLLKILSEFPEKIDYLSFIKNNSWNHFGKFFYNHVK